MTQSGRDINPHVEFNRAMALDLTCIVNNLVIDGKAKPWKRAGGNMRTGKRANLNAHVSNGIAWQFKALINGRPLSRKEIFMVFDFYLIDPIGGHSGDFDNLAKLVADAGEGVLYENDRQIVGAHIWKIKCDTTRDQRTVLNVFEINR